MKLLFDIGNTFIKWAYSDDDGVQPSARVFAKDVSLSKLESELSGMPRPDAVWVSNVGHKKIVSEVIGWCNQVYNINPNIIEVSNSCCGIDNRYLTQDTLGVDRWVAALGARAIVPEGHVIIIDAGTAVTIDWLSQADKFEGGVILPGLNLMHASLNRNTAGISTDYSITEKVIGRTTKECVNAGITYGLIGAVERVIMEMQKKFSGQSTTLLTGGSASMIESMSNFEMNLQRDLVLLGVAKASTEVR